MSEVSKKYRELAHWSPGQELDHRKLNEPVDAIEALQAQVFSPFQAPNNQRQFGVSEFVFVSDDEDYFWATPQDESGEDSVAIAKPYTLRNSVTSRAGLTFEYTGTQARTADDGSETEGQVVVPSYTTGDKVYAARASTPTNIEFTRTDGTMGEVLWVDINADGRQWAKQSE